MKGQLFSLILTSLLFILLPGTSCKKEQPPVVNTSLITNISGSGAVSGGKIVDEGTSGIISAGVCWGEGTLPTVDYNKTSDQVVNNEFKSEIKGLKPSTTYYVRSYATNSAGTSYGDTTSFTTFGGLPFIEQWGIDEIKNTYARLYVKVKPNYVSTTVSFEYGLAPNNTKTVVVDQGAVTYGKDTVLTATLQDLAAGKQYVFRIKAENSFGNFITSDLFFETPVTGLAGTISDIEGNTYKTIGIGWQYWMAENLRASRYNDGTPIQNIKDSTAWASPPGAAYCDYLNDSTVYSSYGRLYNWYAVTTANPKNVCPAGWHVPAEVEWNSLLYFLSINGYSCDGISGNKLAKSLSAPTSWNSSDVAGSPGNNDYPTLRNKSGFNALAGGFRSISTFGYLAGGHGYKGDMETWWSSSMKSSTEAFNFIIDIWSAYVVHGYDNKVSGMHIRCIKDK